MLVHHTSHALSTTPPTVRPSVLRTGRTTLRGSPSLGRMRQTAGLWTTLHRKELNARIRSWPSSESTQPQNSSSVSGSGQHQPSCKSDFSNETPG